MLLVRLKKSIYAFAHFKPQKASTRISELFGAAEEVGNQVRTAVEKNRLRKSKELAEHNQKVRNYHFYEYRRGEDFIENIPIDHGERYNLKDKIAQQQEKQRVSIEELRPIENHVEKANIIREKVAAYHDKQRKYQMEEFQRYLNEYPGTVRGPRPEDDPQAFRQYAFKKIPKTLLDQFAQKAQFKRLAQDKFGGEDDGPKDDAAYQPPRIEWAGTLLEHFGKDRDIIKWDSTREQKEMAFVDYQRSYGNQQIFDESKLEVPMIPSLDFHNYQAFINHWIGWMSFRNSWVTNNLENNMKTTGEKLERLLASLMEGHDQYMPLPNNINSLYCYYKTLPKHIQQHPGLKDIYLGLQYTAPDFAFQEKQNAINETCPQFLPFDDISLRILTDYTIRSRFRPTPYIHDKIMTISPEFTWDIDMFLDELRKQELRGETSNQNKDLKYPEPPEVHKMWEEGAPNLPVDYYQNDDGFWDSIISQKLKRYDQFRPMLKTRRHFTH